MKKDIMLRTIALYSVLGELCDLARMNKTEAASELLRLEPRIFNVLDEITESLAMVMAGLDHLASTLPTSCPNQIPSSDN